MFECKVLTVRDLDFKDERNKPVKGMQLWVIAPSDDPSWNGFEVCKIWVPDGHRCESDVAALKYSQSRRSWVLYFKVHNERFRSYGS